MTAFKGGKAAKLPSMKGAAAKVVARELDELSVLEHSSYRIGFHPRDALAMVSGKFAVERVAFDLRRQLLGAWPGADPGGKALLKARADVDKALSQLSDAEVAEARRWLRATVGDVPAAKDKASLLAAIRQQFDDEMPQAGKRVSMKPPRSTAFESIESLAWHVDEVLAAQRTFEQACIHAESKQIHEAGEALKAAVKKYAKEGGLGAKEVARCRDAIDTVMRSFDRAGTTPGGANAVAAFHAALRALDPDDPFVVIYRRLASHLDAADLGRVGELLARMPPADKIPAKVMEKMSRHHVNAIKGLLGELIGRKGPYRELFKEQLARANDFIEGPAGKTWKVYVARTPIRGLNSKEVLALFYDDAILLVDESAGKAAMVFTAQFKAGDLASLKVFRQLDSDEVREGLGKLFVDGKLYDIDRTVLDAERAIVTTKLGVLDETVPLWEAPPTAAAPAATAAAIGTKDVRFVPMPAGIEDLDAMATFLLRATKKI